MQKEMERIFNLTEDRDPMFSDQKLNPSNTTIATAWNAGPAYWNKNSEWYYHPETNEESLSPKEFIPDLIELGFIPGRPPGVHGGRLGEYTKERYEKVTATRKANGSYVPANKGIPHTLETRKKMSDKAKLRKHIPDYVNPFHKKLECPHCGKVGQYGNMKRWHMDNCRNK